ncbi:DUF6916 family protein [Brevundimonas lenta]|uniref:DUF6916 domain-containing protein n=1 Tax=Brevundimonas lenta TaxID=424796 RepID=A0A7W6NP21_9CAUL|nr:hypothetical protein [Brevundimonas lenta]MBB4081740.1 hypothetical protein [Brevundimonas lenta]
MSDSLVFLTLEDFMPFVGREVLVDATPQPLAIRLDSAVPVIDTGLGQRTPFTLTFSTPWTTLLTEAHYPIQVGKQVAVIHLIPTQTAPGPRRFYHAVFN